MGAHVEGPAAPVRSGPDEDPVDGPGGPAFWLTAAIGAALIAFGIRGLLAEERAGAPSAAKWFVGGALVIDLVVIPLGAAAGWVARRYVPSWAWPVVRTALFTSMILVVFAAPLVLDAGGDPGNPTIRPRPYGSGLAWSLAAVWAIAAVALAIRRWARSRQGQAPRGGPNPRSSVSSHV